MDTPDTPADILITKLDPDMMFCKMCGKHSPKCFEIEGSGWWNTGWCQWCIQNVELTPITEAELRRIEPIEPLPEIDLDIEITKIEPIERSYPSNISGIPSIQPYTCSVTSVSRTNQEEETGPTT